MNSNLADELGNAVHALTDTFMMHVFGYVKAVKQREHILGRTYVGASDTSVHSVGNACTQSLRQAQFRQKDQGWKTVRIAWW